MNLSKWLLFISLLGLYLLHNDLWFWNDPSLVAGIPVGLFYHIAFCFITSLLFIFIVKRAWPSHLEVEKDGFG